jgi:hypothetical protein
MKVSNIELRPTEAQQLLLQPNKGRDGMTPITYEQPND